ncbi:universal stress protein [Paenarthrobacter sp. NPDC090522]|uniref:universal stress protein n=1 Tax=Paenarthrobacter sp. NPDC090522 TaxID=3364383 RepID=UPI0037F6A64A
MGGIVVVGVDGSETARRAADAAAGLASALGAKLHVVTAFSDERVEVVGSGSDQLIVSDARRAEKVARDVAVELRSDTLEADYFAIHGSPAQALIKQAETHDASMIVVGNKRMRGIGRVLGSIANTVAHSAPCDVYIVKTDQ